MTQISYAQNNEDIVLRAVLCDVETGFYIDVGANNPQHHSVTRLFYECGWRGINIEPVKEFYNALTLYRPLDINLNCFVGNKKSVLNFYKIVDSGLSTYNKKIYKRHRSKGFKGEKIKVASLTLTDILNQYLPSQQPIHFLKIDVEGAEKLVLKGIDFKIYRPWVVVLESTYPLTKVPSYWEWENILIKSGYKFAYFDGLNRFYVGCEHVRLIKNFPPVSKAQPSYLKYRMKSIFTSS